MKRIGIAVLALAVLLSAIACGSGIEAQAQPTTAPAATEQAMLPPTETPTEEPVETPQPLRIEDLAGKWRMTPEEIEVFKASVQPVYESQTAGSQWQMDYVKRLQEAFAE